jgi:hypothetical protein
MHGSALDNTSAIQNWQLFAALLPLVIAKILGFFRVKNSQTKGLVATAVYLVYALIGEAIKGTFNSLTWHTPADVGASLVKIAVIAISAYTLLNKAFPSSVVHPATLDTTKNNQP